tara:strand:+ start:20022 stop:20237 length:216 start_codon:yes stop_codon:yes gene_type:complete
MLSLAFITQLKADDQTMPALSITDPEAFFMFLANSVEERGELITPLDIEELEAEELDINDQLNSKQEETIQ